jgi:DNA polymerase-3 subunit gamma/tau
MSTNAEQLNLARKWRPKTFDSIVGQEIPVRMLKNSLYLKKFFPVYLFAGQRGCGKTSTARVFAAAVNCLKLAEFQIDPTIQIPCLTCESCIAMARGHHPDFIEIDAASHTGVDNVRQIIESSTYMPLNGQKKIYLIDEAHMLSKAAFNAFLKILEEPPMSVLFILATTEIQKVPPTVLSRCFQALFTSLHGPALKAHLQSICTTEQVSIDDDALDILIQETEGCARDALNLLERVRFSGTHITQQTMLELLGKVNNQLLFSLMNALVEQNSGLVLQILQENNFEQLSATALWDALIHLFRTLMWVYYGVKNVDPRFGSDFQILLTLAQECSINRLQSLAQLLWSQEELFLKTNKKHIFLEMILLQMCQEISLSSFERTPQRSNTRTPSAPHQVQRPKISSFTSTTKQAPEHLVRENLMLNANKQNINTPLSAPVLNEAQESQISNTQSPPLEAAFTPWKAFLEQLTGVDHLLNSIMSQAKFIEHNEQARTITIELSNKSAFFKDKVDECKSLWLPLLKGQFPGIHDVLFTAADQPPSTSRQLQSNFAKNDPSSSTQEARKVSSPSPFQSSGRVTPKTIGSQGGYEQAVNIQDADKWPIANLLVRHFPGKIKQTKVYS